MHLTKFCPVSAGQPAVDPVGDARGLLSGFPGAETAAGFTFHLAVQP